MRRVKRNNISKNLKVIPELLLMIIFYCSSVSADAEEFFELGPIHYSASEPKNNTSELAKKIYAPVNGVFSDLDFLKAILEELDVPAESQVLVYSKTSAQKKRIFPRYPRAIYFSESTYVGYVPGGAVEVITHDPRLGLVFYLIESKRSKLEQENRNVGFKVIREKSCLSCHVTSNTRDVPGLFLRSVMTDDHGEVDFKQESHIVDDETPLSKRWGGWYVTGNWSGVKHMGNDFKGRSKLQKLENLIGKIQVNRYIKSTSDVAALMVLEHQCKIHTILVEAKLLYERAVHLENALKLTGAFNGENSAAMRTARNSAEEIVSALLFCNEADIAGDGIQGGREFEEAFTAMARSAKSGKHLRKFRLYGRLFKYRCSYMIHSEAFDALPDMLKKLTFKRLHEVLTAETPPEKYQHLKRREKKIILEILQETTEMKKYTK